MVASRSELQCCPGTGSGQQGPPDSSRKRARADGGERLLAKQEGTERRRENRRGATAAGAASAPPFVLTRSRPHASHGRAKETPAAGPFVPMAGATTRRAARLRRARLQPTAPRWPWRRAGAARCVALPPRLRSLAHPAARAYPLKNWPHRTGQKSALKSKAVTRTMSREASPRSSSPFSKMPAGIPPPSPRSARSRPS